MAAFSARNARISYEGTNLLGLKWSINVKVDEIDVSNFEGRGYVDYIGGLWEADVSFDAIVDNSRAGPGNFTQIWPGKLTLPVIFYFDAGTARHVTTAALVASATVPATRGFLFGSLLITSVSVEAEVRSFVRMSVTAKNAGLFSMPTTG